MAGVKGMKWYKRTALRKSSKKKSFFSKLKRRVENRIMGPRAAM